MTPSVSAVVMTTNAVTVRCASHAVMT